MPPVAPMLSKSVPALPIGEEWAYEPKWDGFRTIVFRDGDEVELGSRNEKPMTRYFPEVVAALRAALPPRCVVDGEIVVVGPNDRLEFELLQERIHPAASRVAMLAERTPARFIAFDLLAIGDEDLRARPYSERRARLVAVLEPGRSPAVSVTPCTTNSDTAADWFARFEGIGCDGIIAKRLGDPYVEDKRTMMKIKHQRTADCVVAGFRWHKSGGIVGSLLLGLWDGDHLNHVGVTASFTMARRATLVQELQPWRLEAGDPHPWADWIAHEAAEASSGKAPMPGSRWNAKKDLSFESLRLGLVCEVAYDHLQGHRFRHATTFVRWRPDRTPESCTYAQIEVPVETTVTQLLGLA